MQSSEYRDGTAPAPAGSSSADPHRTSDAAGRGAASGIASETDLAGEPVGSGLTDLLSDIKLLATDAKSLAQAELAYQTSRAKVAGGAARGIAASVVIAAVFALYALLALVVGLLLALTPLVSAWGATAIVAGVLVIGAVLFLIVAARKWRHLKHVLAGDSDI